MNRSSHWPRGWKVHIITKIKSYQNSGSDTIWYKSACRLISSDRPTKKSEIITCLRCLKALKRAVATGKKKELGL